MYRIEWEDGSTTLDLGTRDRAVELVLQRHPEAHAFAWRDPVLSSGEQEDYPDVCGFWADETALISSVRALAFVREEHAQDTRQRELHPDDVSYYEAIFETFLTEPRTGDTLPPPADPLTRDTLPPPTLPAQGEGGHVSESEGEPQGEEG